MRRISIVLGCVAALGLAACSEKPQQTAGAKVKGSAPAWQGAKDEFVAPGWKAGDQASWEAQMRERGKGQNEYARIGGAS
jgi:hypothetical protein